MQAKTVVRLSDPEAARLVLDENAQRLLRPFLGQDNTAKVGVSLSLMAYWLGRFQSLGLIELVREEKRAGRPVKVYRTTADAFVAPFELLPSATLAEFFGSFGEAQQQRFVRALGRVSEAMAASDWGLKLSRRDDGKVRINAVPDGFSFSNDNDTPQGTKEVSLSGRADLKLLSFGCETCGAKTKVPHRIKANV